MASNKNPLKSLINEHLRALRISKAELAALCGYRNIAKGIRRLEQVSAGDISRAHTLLAKLPEAMQVEPALVEAAIAATEAAKRREDEQRYHKAFRPHAIIQTERSVPEPIWLALVLGVENLLRIEFAEGSPPVSYVSQALATLRRRCGGSGGLPAFGAASGFIVNYTPDKSVSFLIDGTPLSDHERAVRIAEAWLSLRTSRIPVKALPP